MTGGILPEPSIMALLENANDVPIVSVQQGTFETTNIVGNVKPKIYADSKNKINTSIALFDAYVDGDKLLEGLSGFASSVVTPYVSI